MAKKNLFFVVLVTLCLATVLFTISPILSSSSATGQWDPWADVSGINGGQPDGVINMQDIAYLVALFNIHSNGTNIDRVLYSAKQSQIDNLTLRIDNLNASLVDLRSEVESMNATNMMPLIDSLNASLIGLQSDIGDMNLSLANEIESRKANDSSLTTYIDALNTRVDSLDAQIVMMNEAITTLQTSNANLDSRVSALEAEVNALEANYSVTNLKLAPYAVPFNSTYSTTYGSTTEQYPNWNDMPDMTVTLNLTRASKLIIMFSGELQNLGPGTTREDTWICIQAKINNDVALPSEFNTTTVDPSGTGMLMQGHYLRWGIYSCTFYSQTLNAGFYTIKLRWDCTVGKAEARSRDLVVIALPA